jgi:hypothetical protein
MSQQNSIEIQYSLTVATRQLQRDINKVEVSMMRILSYIERLTPGNPSLSNLIQYAQQTITILRSLQMAIRAVQLASGPIGWLYAGTSIAAAGFTGYAMYESMRGV